MEATLHRSRKAGLLVAVGGSIPEFIYSILALSTGLFLQQLPGAFFVFRVITALVLLTIGLLFILKKTTSSTEMQQYPERHFLLKGFFLGILNPQLLPFWLIVYTSFFSLTGLSIDSTIEYIGFVAGTGCGAFALHLVLIYFTDSFRVKLARWIQLPFLNRIIGGFFVLLAILQVVSL